MAGPLASGPGRERSPAQGNARRCSARIAFALQLLMTMAALGFAQADVSASFDYYVLSLSWSPQYCASAPARDDHFQCQHRKYGFVVHGLWPQYRGGSRSYCKSREPRSVGTEILRETIAIMPSKKLINHQWNKHGTCSGLDQERYFAATRQAFESLEMPEAVVQGRLTRTNRRGLLAAIRENNPKVPESAFVLRCDSADFAELRVCFSRDLEPTPCGTEIRGNCPTTGIRIRPLR